LTVQQATGRSIWEERAVAESAAVVAARGENRRWRWQRSTLGELASEFLGTFVLISFGNGVVATAVVALNQSGRGTQGLSTAADWLLICWGWGFAVAFGVWVAGGVTGAHLNPAVTLAQALKRGFPWSKVPAYCAVQLAGAFVGAALVYFDYRYAIGSFEHAKHIARGGTDSVPTFSIFGTTPAPYFSSWFGPFADQVIGTAFLVAFIPARDLGPRLLAWLEGWKSIAVPGDYGNVNGYLWIPIVGPLVGGAIGAFVYDFAVRNVLKARGVQPDPDVEEMAETAID
jgi:glycerol uptake facilitator protein